jgi:type II secretory pathway pseudopilin PulG
LVEILIVIGIIAILASSLITLIDPLTQLRKSRDAKRKSDLSQIQSAFELYRSDIGNYPLEEGPGGVTNPGGALKCNNFALMGGTPPNTYMKKVPCDPLPSGPYATYFYSDDPPFASYKLWACLENISDEDRDGDDQTAADICPNVGSQKRVSYTLENP